ncbi:MAG TPA: hypothetical protein VFU04_04600, partial [Solirubrobacterales bacterium]|nr:hypothetical protein [Solirubrobacterales bacterium]
APWFQQRVARVPLYLVGTCSGGRAAIELAGRYPDRFAGLLLIAPLLQTLFDPESEPDSVDPELVEYLRASLDHVFAWILVGEDDLCDVPRLVECLGPDRVEVEVVPGMALHFADHPPIQRELYRRLSTRLSAALATKPPDLPAQPARR